MASKKLRLRLHGAILFQPSGNSIGAWNNYYDDGGYSAKANPDLKPATIQTYEVVLEHSFAGGLRSAASVYHYNLQDLVSLTTDPADGLQVFDNVERISATGIELELEGRIARVLDGRFSYAYQRDWRVPDGIC